MCCEITNSRREHITFNMISRICNSVDVACGEIPHPDNLCCVEVSIRPPAGSTPKSVFHLQTTTCRRIIFENPEVIASPHWETFMVIYVVMNKDDFKYEKLIAMSRILNLSLIDPTEVSHEIYKMCMLFTVSVKCAPLWNQVEKYLLYGTGFLWSSFRSPAVKLDISIGKNEAYLVAKSLAVAIDGIKLQDLCIPEDECRAFMNNDTYIIKQEHIRSPLVYLLPSFIEGRVINISREIPDESIYRTYEAFSLHWRETYGYVLPDHERRVDYYTVSFTLNNALITDVFPSYCVRKYNITFPRDIHPHITLDMFDRIMSDEFPLICGLQFLLMGKLLGRLPEMTKCVSSRVSSSSDSSTDSEENDDSDEVQGKRCSPQ